MLRSAFRRNLFPIALITVGCLIFLAIILFLFRSQMEMVGWVVLGLLMIAVGVLGIVVTSPKTAGLAGDEPTASSQASSETSPPSTTEPGYSTAHAGEVTPGQQNTTTIPRPMLIAGGVLLGSIVLLLLCNLGTALLPLFTVHETQIVDCRVASDYVEDSWRFVSAYSYNFEDDVSGYTERTDCVMERERYVWTGEKRTPKDDASSDDAFNDDVSDDDASSDDVSDDDADVFDPPSYWEPTQPPFTRPPATQLPQPTPTSLPVNPPAPTETLPPSSASSPTNTPLPPTPSPVPRTDINVCEAALNDTYLNIYVQWEGVIIDTPTLEDEGLWFQVQWTNSDPNSECSQAAFFVSFDSSERFFEEDRVAVTGTIIDINYEYEGEAGQTEYTVVVSAANVKLLDEP